MDVTHDTIGTMTKKTLIAILVARFILGISALSLAGTCQETGHQQKSTAYQRCRTIPPAERAKRVACFKQADTALQQCLAACKSPTP